MLLRVSLLNFYVVCSRVDYVYLKRRFFSDCWNPGPVLHGFRGLLRLHSRATDPHRDCPLRLPDTVRAGDTVTLGGVVWLLWRFCKIIGWQIALKYKLKCEMSTRGFSSLQHHWLFATTNQRLQATRNFQRFSHVETVGGMANRDPPSF